MNTEKLKTYEKWTFSKKTFLSTEDMLEWAIYLFHKMPKKKILIGKLDKIHKLELKNGLVLKSEKESKSVILKRNGEILYI